MQWQATYSDGAVIEQPATSIPISYYNVDTNNLVSFNLRGGSTSIGVDLKLGTIIINGKKVSFENFSRKKDYRLIYFVKEDCFYVGLQTTIDGKNLKRIVELNGEKVKILA